MQKFRRFARFLMLLFMIIIGCMTVYQKVNAAEDEYENNITIRSEKGNIEYITLNKKATNTITWATIGFNIRLDTALGNPLLNAKYIPIYYSDEGVTQTNEDIGYYIETKYTFTEKAIIHGLERAGMLDEFNEHLANNINEDGTVTIYLNGIFQVKHSGVAYGNPIYVHKDTRDYNGGYQEGIYDAESWADPSTFYQYFDIQVEYEPALQPIKVMGITNANILLFEESLDKQKAGNDVSYTLPDEYIDNGITYKLKKSHYYNMGVNKKGNKGKRSLIDGYSLSEVRNRTVPVLTGGTMIVGVYRVKIDIDTETIEDEFIEQELIEPIPQGEIKSKEFEVEDGIPTTEYILANATTTDYLSQYIFVKKVGIIEIYVTVSKTYTLTNPDSDSGGDGEETEPPNEEPITVTKEVTVKRPYAYWTIEYMDVYFLKKGIINNQALEGEVKLTYDQTKPVIIYTKTDDIDSHVIIPEKYKEEFVLEGDMVVGTEVPDEDFEVLVEPQIGDVIVKNDKLVFYGETIMSDEETEKEGERPKNPFTGNGFTKAINGHIIPEFKSVGYLEMSNGAELWEISKGGKETLKAVYSKLDKCFIKVE